MSEERRINRSKLPVLALHMLLEACRTRGGFDALLVADEHGFLVGASDARGGIDAREVAADLLVPQRRTAHGRVTSVPFRFMDRMLYVAGLGEGRAGTLVDAVFGARRILAA